MMQFMRVGEPFADPWPNAAASVAQDGDVALVPPGVLLEWHRGQWIPLRDRVARGMRLAIVAELKAIAARHKARGHAVKAAAVEAAARRIRENGR